MNEKQLFKQTWTQNALILGIGLFVFSILLGFLGQAGNPQAGWLNMIIYIAIVVLALRTYKAGNNQGLKLGRAVGMGALIGLLGGLIAGVLLLLYYTVIDPGMLDQIIEAGQERTLEAIEKQGVSLSPEQMEEMMDPERMRTWSLVGIGAGSPIMTCLACVIVALVAGLVMKNDVPEHHNVDEI